ncbi:MAG TPA: IscS subfamily cysteine desulfurase [Puia sp.]
MPKLPIYFDNNATTPCDPRVVETMLPYFTEKFGNAASRTHAYGWEGEEAVELAREQIARLVGAETKEIVLTSGATEADNLAIKGVFEMYAGKGNHIITVATEHKAVLDTCHHIGKSGGEVSFLSVNREGLIDLAALEAAIRPTTVLISVMYANNEIGVIQPIREISQIARRHKVLFFVDAAQAVGKVPVDVNKDGIDLMAISAHKLYGPKGVGALYVRRKEPRVRLTAQMDGGGHERGMRSGTLNVPAIAGFGKACELCRTEMEKEAQRVSALRDRLEKGLLEIPLVYLNGSREHRLPGTTNLSFQYVSAEGLLTMINKDVALSSGSACTSASLEPSYVLKALGLDDELAHGSLRFGLGRFNTAEEVDYVIQRLKAGVERLRAASPSWEEYKDK